MTSDGHIELTWSLTYRIRSLDCRQNWPKENTKMFESGKGIIRTEKTHNLDHCRLIDLDLIDCGTQLFVTPRIRSLIDT